MDNLNSDVVQVTAHAYDWIEKDKYGDDDQMVVHAWCLDRESKPCLVRFLDFPVFCQIELPSTIRNKKYRWRPAAVRTFFDMICRRLGDDAPTRYTFNMHRKTYWYQMDKRYPMMQLCFTNLDAMRHCKNMMNKALKTDDWGWIKCNVWEDRISTVRKLLTVRDVKYSQWFTVNARKTLSELQVSTVENEYIAHWDTLTAVPEDECSEWSSHPGILSFDIETYSDRHVAMPDKYNALHVAYMVSCIYQRYGLPEHRRRYGIIIGDCDQIPPDRLENCEIISVKTELELIDAFAYVTRETDPEIFTGYNILAYDYPYLNHRLERWLVDWPCMGRMIGVKSHMKSSTWDSGAYGHQDINILQMEGRISVDLMPIIKRDYKLDSYRLDFVCKKFIGKTKHDVKASEMFAIYENMQNSLMEVDRITNGDHAAPDYQSRLDAAIEQVKIARADTTRVMEYCIQDSELVLDLSEEINLWPGLVEMSNIVGTTIVDLFTRGQQVRCMSLLYDEASRKGYVLDKRPDPKLSYTGGHVFHPIVGVHDNVICLDFSSLYPSIIQAYNICYTTLVPPELEHLVPDSDCYIAEFDQEETITTENGTETVTRHYKYKFYKHFEGLIPRLVRAKVEERRAVRRRLAKTKQKLKLLQKHKSLRLILEAYLDQNVPVMSVAEVQQKLDELAAMDPAPEADVITAMKFNMEIAEVFDLSRMQKQLDKLDDDTPEDAAEYTQLAYEISRLYSDQNMEGLRHHLNAMQADQETLEKKIKSFKLQCVVLNKRQLALKVTGNSFYGFLGVRKNGRMPLMEGAISTTAIGRMLIQAVQKYVEDTYGGVQIYGDTDSVMMWLPQVKDSADCNYWGIRLAEEISGIKPGGTDCDGVTWPEGRPGLFLSPLAMEFEKAMRILCIKKKKYAALLIGKDGKFKTEDVMDKNGNVIGSRLMKLLKGIVLARRDNCIMLRTLYHEVLDMILNGRPMDRAINAIVDTVQRLVNGDVPLDDLVIYKGLGANYKSASYCMKVFADELKKAGKLVSPGDRLEYVVVVDPNARLLGQKMRLKEQYLESLETDTPLQIDYNYYLEKVLANPLDQLVSIGYKDIITKMQHVSYRPTNRHKRIYLDRPVHLMFKMRERGYDIDIFRQAFQHNYDKLMAPPKKLQLEIIQEENPSPSIRNTPRRKLTLPNIARPKVRPLVLDVVPQ